MDLSRDRGSGARGAATRTVLRELLRKRHMLPYRVFRQEYVKVARRVDERLVGTFPAEGTYKRWLSGRIVGLPRSEACIVLEAMFPDCTVEQLFSPVPQVDAEDSTVLYGLLRQRYLHGYRAFCDAYSKAAATIDSKLIHSYPAERQFYRWITGDIVGLPYPHHCQVLEAMFPGYTARQLFEIFENDSIENHSQGTSEGVESVESSAFVGALLGADPTLATSRDASPFDRANLDVRPLDSQPADHALIDVASSRESKLPHASTVWNLDSVAFELETITGEDLTTSRRKALAGAAAIFVGTALTDPLQQWLHPLGSQSGFIAASGSGFSVQELSELSELVHQFKNWNAGGNRALARKAVIAQLNDLTDRLHDAASTGPLTIRAFRLAAELAEVAATMSWDAGLQRAAQRYYVAAVKLAKLANDNNFAAVTLAALARQCYDLGHPQDGLEIVQLAQYGTRRTATPRLRAMLATREAWSYAQRAEFQAFHRAVRLAEDHFSEGISDEDDRFVRNFDNAELMGVIGARFRDLARHDPKYARNAQEYIRAALNLRHPSQLRNRAFDLIGLARAHLITSEPDYACILIHQAIPIVRPWASGRVGAKLQEFHQEAGYYAANSTIRDTRDAINELIPGGK